MYDFTVQNKMLNVAYKLLKERKLLNIAAFGGGTALSAYYWNHRFSTDIDIFLYGKEDCKHSLREKTWSEEIQKEFLNIGYKKGNMINHPQYLEFKISDEEKIQFLDVVKRTDIPYKMANIFGLEIQIETVNEIIAKKVYFRGHKGNSRDIFDIAIALHKNPYIFQEIKTPLDKLQEFFNKLSEIKENTQLLEDYKNDIKELSPKDEYKKISIFAIDYLIEYLNDFIYMKYIGQELTKKESFELEKMIYSELSTK